MKEYKDIEEFHEDYKKFIESEDAEFIDFIDKNLNFIEGIDNDENSLRTKYTILSEYGLALIRHGNLTRGKEILRKGFTLVDENWKVEEFEKTPYNEKLLWNYGIALSETNDDKEAEKVFKHLAKLYPDNDKYQNWYKTERLYKYRKIKNILWFIFILWFILNIISIEILNIEFNIYRWLLGAGILIIIFIIELYSYIFRKMALTHNSKS